jgi:hypothetical protein
MRLELAQTAADFLTVRGFASKFFVNFHWGILGGIWAKRATSEVFDTCHTQICFLLVTL